MEHRSQPVVVDILVVVVVVRILAAEVVAHNLLVEGDIRQAADRIHQALRTVREVERHTDPGVVRSPVHPGDENLARLSCRTMNQ